jgi:predicted ATP-grasp superfamily ATP-dependent carboligase
MNAPALDPLIVRAAERETAIRALVVLGNTVTALAVARDAAAHGLGAAIVDTNDGIAFRTRRAAKHLLREAAEHVVLERLLELARQTPSALIASGDVWLRFLMRHREVLDRAFVSVLHPGNAALETCLSKAAFARFCRAKGLDAPLAWLAGTEPRPPELHVPVLIRPAETLHGRDGHGLPKAVEARTEQELADWLARFAAGGVQALVTESLLAEAVVQYSVPAARTGSKLVTFVARKLRPAPECCAVGTYVELSPESAVESLARRTLDALDYRGIAEVEVLHVPRTGRNYLIEVNARPWLQYALAPASGHDFLGLVTGRQLPGEAAPRKKGVRWIDFRADLFACWSRSMGLVRNGKLDALGYLQSLVRANVFAVFTWADPGPWLARTLRIGGSR